MDSNYYVWIGAGVIALIIILYFILTASRRRKQKLLAKILASYGSASQREYLPEDIRKIKKYYDTVKKDGEFTIDDITWNDLDMDSVFCQMNHTFSSPGEEELYRILRTPVFSSEKLQERDEKIKWLSENELQRTELSLEFAGIGRTKKICLAESLEQFKNIKLKDNIGYFLHLILLIIAIAVTFIKPFIGILAIIVVMAYNLITYYKQKAEIETYYLALSCYAYIAKAGKRILKLQTPVFAKENEELRKALKPLEALKKDDFWLGAATGTQLSTNPLYLLLDYFRMMTHMDFVAFNHMVKTIQGAEEDILKVLQILGEMEALIAISSYRETIPFYTQGEFGEENRAFEIVDAYHPLIREPVANSIATERPVLLTGSNASGKSTFLRTVAINVILAETVCTAHCHSLSMNFFRVYSSMALNDSVESGESYYIVEIKSLKRILDAVEGEERVLCFIDEVLRGTNTIERIAASSQILKAVSESGAMVFAATHDVELTKLLEKNYENKHFEEQVIDGQVVFDYILKDGKATTRNAIKLLASLGYDENLTEKAEQQAKSFENEGTWKLL